MVGVQIEQLLWKTISFYFMLLNNHIPRNSTLRYIPKTIFFLHVHQKTGDENVASSTLGKNKKMEQFKCPVATE